jgi:hypothetical protein
MKTVIRLIILSVVALNCSTGKVSGKTDLSGTWDWKCCGGKYYGKLQIIQGKDNKIKGQMSHSSTKAGSILEGTLNGDILTFTRIWDTHKQYYILQIGTDRNSMSGNFKGDIDKYTGEDFSAVRN